jgi:hypothetical protein
MLCSRYPDLGCKLEVTTLICLTVDGQDWILWLAANNLDVHGGAHTLCMSVCKYVCLYCVRHVM